MNHNLHLGVTGLRRTGKTVFLTALIYQLVELGSQNLAAFEGRGVTLRPATIRSRRNSEIKQFPFINFLTDLRAETPTWPPPTDREFEITLQFNYQNGAVNGRLDRLKRLIGQDRSCGSITLHLHDYPGEYLLDASLARQSYREWCCSVQKRMAKQLPDVAKSYGDLAGQFRNNSDSELLGKLRNGYAEYAKAARSKGLEYVQPAKPLMEWHERSNGQQSMQEIQPEELPFVPLPDEFFDHKSCDPRPLLVQQMEAEFRKYVATTIHPFIKRIHRCRMQLVLVDVLRILRNGVGTYNDTRACIAEILGAYHQVWRPLGGIRQVHFAATKADHAKKSDRANMAKLLGEIVTKAKGQMKAGVRTGTPLWFTSLRSTDDIPRPDGSGGHALRGVRIGYDKPDAYEPGEVLDKWPEDKPEDEWKMGDGDSPFFPEFRPRRFDKRDGASVPHLNLDDVIWRILEDCF